MLFSFYFDWILLILQTKDIHCFPFFKPCYVPGPFICSLTFLILSAFYADHNKRMNMSMYVDPQWCMNTTAYLCCPHLLDDILSLTGSVCLEQKMWRLKCLTYLPSKPPADWPNPTSSPISLQEHIVFVVLT